MKQFNRYVISVPQCVMVALLLFFGSCQSSDNTNMGEGASVASLPLTAQIGESLSRVGMNDTYGGAFSCYWNSDKFKVYHKYVQSGSIQNITPLDFSTSANGGTSAIFSYKGSSSYRYNPGSRLYAFSSNTIAGYTMSVTDAGVSTLKATTLSNQNGTLTDCAKYDALYGSAGVNYSTGLPGLLTMHHLFGMMNLHLTNSNFSASYPVTVKLTSSIANILPGNGGNATIDVNGTLNKLVGSWNTSWSTTITPTTGGVVDVYFMTWPFSKINGTLTVSCLDKSGNIYVDRNVKLSGFSLAAAQLKSKPLAITSTLITPDTYSSVYAWDATNYQMVELQIVPTNANTSASAADYINHASYACKNCPNANEISWYLSVDCYWDNGSINGGNSTSYKVSNNNYTTAGMWFRKRSGIPGFSSTSSYGNIAAGVSRAPIALTDALASSLDLSANYFFLPAIGFTDSDTGGLNGYDETGYYWSSTPGNDALNAYGLGFGSTIVSVSSSDRRSGYSLWVLQ